MTLYMLDTNAASEALRGHPAFDSYIHALLDFPATASALDLQFLIS